ncbi:MAG: glycosyltransferase, partial [Chloroflexota bacterium]
QYGGFAKGFERRIYDLGKYRPDDPMFPYNPGLFGSGNNMAFRRDVLESIGRFDPILGNGTPALGGVDIEAFFRVIIAGHRLVYEPNALVRHLHRADYQGLARQVYSFSVGTTATLTKSLLRNPGLLPSFVRALPAAVRFTFTSSSPLHEGKAADYPRELTWLDRKGLLYGPIAYLRSCFWWKSVARSRR